MFRYMLIVLLVNTYSRSLGGPVDRKIINGNIVIGDLLTTLSKQCQNPFAVNQIESKLRECNVVAPPYQPAQMQCLLFLDANNLLCDSTTITTILPKDFTVKINEPQHVKSFCSNSSLWNFPPSVHKNIILKVFNEVEKCIMTCAEKDLLGGDTTIATNFFCKYYKWTLELLNKPLLVAPTTLKPKITLAPSLPGKPDIEVRTDLTHPSNITGNSNEQVKDVPDIVKTTVAKIDDTNLGKAEGVSQESAPTAQPSLPGSQNANQSDLAEVKLTEQSIDDNKLKNSHLETGSEEKPILEQADADKDLSKNIDEKKIGPIQLNESDKEAVIDQPKKKNPIESLDYPDDLNGQDSEEGKEGMSDTQGGDDNDDPMLNEPELKTADDIRTSEKHSNSPINLDGSQREFSPYGMPDNYVDDDDHFFPFFLTVIIIIAVLYVLYHNKNKFFGLIVEGRQSGRRRNSRGHAYKRLDTLEQAMSANAKAPPSKIIY